MALRTKLSFDRHIIFEISLRKIMKNTSVSNLDLAQSAKLCLVSHKRIWSCVKSTFMALRTKLSFDRHIIFEISLREISKIMCLSK